MHHFKINKRPWQAATFIACIAMFVDVCVHLSASSAAGHIDGHIRPLRCFRAIIFVNFFKSARRTVSVAKSALSDITTIVVVTLIFMYITSLFIMLLFDETTKPGQIDYGSFLKTWDSLTFLLYGAVNWPDMMMPAYDHNKLFFLFFGAIAAFGIWILMNIVFAAVYDGFVNKYTNYLTAQYTHELLALLLAFQLLSNFPKHVEDWIDSVPFPRKTTPAVKEIIQEIVLAFKEKGYSSVNRLLSSKNNSVLMHDVEALKKQAQLIIKDALQQGPPEDETPGEQQAMYFKIFEAAFDNLLARTTRASVEMRTMIGRRDEEGVTIKGEEGVLSMSRAFGEDSDEPLYLLLDVSDTMDLHLEEFMALHAYLGLRLHYSAPRWATAGTEVLIRNVEASALLSVNEEEHHEGWSTLLHMPALQRAMGLDGSHDERTNAEFNRGRVVKVGDRVTFEHHEVPGTPLKGTVAGIVESKFAASSVRHLSDARKLNIRLTGVFKKWWINESKRKSAHDEDNGSIPMLNTPQPLSAVAEQPESRALESRMSYMADAAQLELDLDANVP
jgi:hypothetical protein